MHREVEQYQHFSGNAGAGRQLPQVLNAMQGMPLLKAFLHWWHNLPLTREKPLYGLIAQPVSDGAGGQGAVRDGVSVAHKPGLSALRAKAVILILEHN